MKKNNNKDQTIKCDVESCKYNNTDNCECELDEIKISCNCANDDCTCSEETICDSFEEKEDTSDNKVSLYFDTNKDVEEWEYSAIFDFFDKEAFESLNYVIEEIDDEYTDD